MLFGTGVSIWGKVGPLCLDTAHSAAPVTEADRESWPCWHHWCTFSAQSMNSLHRLPHCQDSSNGPAHMPYVTKLEQQSRGPHTSWGILTCPSEHMTTQLTAGDGAVGNHWRGLWTYFNLYIPRLFYIDNHVISKEGEFYFFLSDLYVFFAFLAVFHRQNFQYNAEQEVRISILALVPILGIRHSISSPWV